MSRRTPLFDGKTLTANDTVTSSAVSLQEETTVSLQLQADADATNVSLVVQAKVNDVDEWSHLDGVPVLSNAANDLQNLDVTQTDSNNLILQYDCLDLQALRVKVSEEDGKTPTVDLIASSTDIQ